MQNDGESCPGEERCRNEKGPGKLWKYPDEETETICRGCHLYATKPENMPESLAPHAAAAIELVELEKAGACFSYPSALQAVDWASLAGLTRGLRRADTLRDDRDREERRRNKKGRH